MKFIDRTEIHVTAGRGGDGLMSFHRARNLPKLGPNGGNGGNGGNVILRASKKLNTLSSLRYRQVYKGEPGGKGGTNNKTGRCGQPKIVLVPRGTIVYDRESQECLGELLEDGQTLLVAQGGKRGYGNLHYVSPTLRAPYKFTHGQKGENRTLSLELKVLADVGFAGFPNSGKSTMLSRISSARPKVADYPFTTLTPQLGVVDFPCDDKGGLQSYVVADIPGLVEGASDGKGLGHDFLRHIERTSVIAYIVDLVPLTGEMPDPLDVFAKLQLELGRYNRQLLEKRSVVVLNKIDLWQQYYDKEVCNEKKLAQIVRLLQDSGHEVVITAGLTGEGVDKMTYKLRDIVQTEKELAAAKEELDGSTELEAVNGFGHTKMEDTQSLAE